MRHSDDGAPHKDPHEGLQDGPAPMRGFLASRHASCYESHYESHYESSDTSSYESSAEDTICSRPSE